MLAQAGDVSSHDPIAIRQDADFGACACVTSGSGTNADPFVIGPWAINKVNGIGILVDGTQLSRSFVILNVTIAGNGTNTSTGIVLQNINTSGTPAIVAGVGGNGTTIQALNIGIQVANSSHVVLDGGGANPAGPGVSSITGAINHNFNGAVDVENSSDITVRGWQFSSNGQDQNPDWIALDPSLAHWGVGGVRFFRVADSLIDHNAANNCTSISFSLFYSNRNTVTYNAADYPFTMNFMVADGSSYNTVTGNVAGTGDFIGYLVADPLPGTATLATFGSSHNNLLNGNISHTDGPTGTEIKTSVVPAFLGGFVILNGAYDNQILGNQDWASTGGGFAWAQAALASSPIGVATYKPVLHCNVTASGGGGGVANLNGNVWSGNISKTIDSCIPPQ